MKHTDEHKAKARLESEDACLQRNFAKLCVDFYLALQSMEKNQAPETERLGHTATVPNADSPSEAVDAERRRIIRRAHEVGDFVTGEDGFFVYWPTRLQGALNEWALGVIAEELRRLNAPWVAKMNEYFASADTRPKMG